MPSGLAIAVAAGVLVLLIFLPKLGAFLLGYFGWLLAFPVMVLVSDYLEKSSDSYARSNLQTLYKVIIYVVAFALITALAVMLGFNIGDIADQPMRDQRGYY